MPDTKRLRRSDPDGVVKEGEGQVLFMFATVCGGELAGAHNAPRSPLTSVTWLEAMATSVPVPIEMPTSAAASAGAS